jgi:hypothetical protein
MFREQQRTASLEGSLQKETAGPREADRPLLLPFRVSAYWTLN